MKMNGARNIILPSGSHLNLYPCTGHTHIDILKIDIEGWEFDTLATIVRDYLTADKPLPFGQLQIELHIWKKKFPELLTWWEKLEEAGLRPYMTEVRFYIEQLVGLSVDFSPPPH